MNSALKLQPNPEATRAIQGEIAFLNEDYKQAAFYLNLADKNGRGSARSWYMLGVSNIIIGQYDQAIAAFDETIKLFSDNIDAWYGKGVAYYYKNSWDLAFKALDVTLSNEPDFYEARYAHGLTNLGAGHFKEAINDFNDVIKSGEDYHGSYFENNGVYIDRTRAFYGLNQFEEAVKDLNKQIEDDP